MSSSIRTRNRRCRISVPCCVFNIVLSCVLPFCMGEARQVFGIVYA